MPPPKSEAPISSPANLEARPTVTQEVIVIDSDESDHAGVMEISASRETTHPLTSLHSQSRGDGSLTSTGRSLPTCQIAQRLPNGKISEIPAKETDKDTFAACSTPTPGVLSAPAVKDTVYRRPPANGFSEALSVLNGQKSLHTNPAKSRFSVREVGQKKLDTYISIRGASQQQNLVAVKRHDVLPTLEPPSSPISSHVSSSLPPHVKEQERIRLGSSQLQRDIGLKQKQLETAGSTTTSTMSLAAAVTPERMHVKQEPQSSHQHPIPQNPPVAPKLVPVRLTQEVQSDDTRRPLPQTPQKTTITPKNNSSTYRNTRALTSSGTFGDPYAISSDSDSDSDVDTERGNNPRLLKSFDELDNTAVASSPWTENFREREVSVEAILADVPTWLDFSSPIPCPIPTSSGHGSCHQRLNKRLRNDAVEERSRNLFGLNSRDPTSGPPLRKRTVAFDSPIPAPTPINSGSGPVYRRNKRQRYNVGEEEAAEEEEDPQSVISKDPTSNPPAVKRISTSDASIPISTEISSRSSSSHLVTDTRQAISKEPQNDNSEGKHVSGRIPPSPLPVEGTSSLGRRIVVEISSGFAPEHVLANARHGQTKTPRNDGDEEKDKHLSGVNRDVASSPPTKERTATGPSDDCTARGGGAKGHNKKARSGDKDSKTASRYRNHHRKAWRAKRKLRKKQGKAGGCS